MGAATSVAASERTTVVIPGTTYELVEHESQLTDSGRPNHDLMNAIAAWISAEFALPSPTQSPMVVRASQRRLIALRYREENPDAPIDPPVRNARAEAGHAIVALYHDRARTIYLGKDWTGRTPAEVSVLFHETVHHLQNLAGASFACAGEREMLAYQAQSRFLALFDETLEGAFGIDPMTLLVRTTCVM